jgi:hypothetical protein
VFPYYYDETIYREVTMSHDFLLLDVGIEAALKLFVIVSVVAFFLGMIMSYQNKGKFLYGLSFVFWAWTVLAAINFLAYIVMLVKTGKIDRIFHDTGKGGFESFKLSLRYFWPIFLVGFLYKCATSLWEEAKDEDKKAEEKKKTEEEEAKEKKMREEEDLTRRVREMVEEELKRRTDLPKDPPPPQD